MQDRFSCFYKFVFKNFQHHHHFVMYFIKYLRVSIQCSKFDKAMKRKKIAQRVLRARCKQKISIFKAEVLSLVTRKIFQCFFARSNSHTFREKNYSHFASRFRTCKIIFEKNESIKLKTLRFEMKPSESLHDLF